MNNSAKTEHERRQELNQALELVKSKQQDDLVIDFDQAVEEYRQKNSPIKIKFGGRYYEAPRDAPADVMMFIIRNTEGGAMSDEDLHRFMGMVLGQEFLDALAKSNVPLKLVGDKVTTRIFEEWNIGGQKGYVEETEKKPKTPGS